MSDPKPCTVTVDGTQRDAWLLAWQRDSDRGWRGYVSFFAPDSSGLPGQYLRWVSAGQLTAR